jgi:3-hydroxyisobutyrate dehydrogenase
MSARRSATREGVPAASAASTNSRGSFDQGRTSRPTPAASATKLANQLVLFASTAGLHEALGLTQAFDVEDGLVLEALRSGLGDTWSGRNWGFFDQLASDYDAAGVGRDVRPWSKDPREFVEAAEAAGTPSRVADLLADILPPLIEDHAWAANGKANR